MMSTMDSASIAAIASPRRREIIRLVWQRELAAGDGLIDILPAVAAVLAFGLVTGGIGLARSNRLVRLQ